MLTGIKEMKYMCSSLTQARMCMLRAQAIECIRQSPQKHILLRASALPHSVLQILWEISSDIMATDFLSDLSLLPRLAQICLSAHILLSQNILLGTHRNTDLCILGVFSSSQERASCQEELA